jgi:hypothetical protein
MLFLDDVEETMNKIIIVAVGLLGASLLTAVPAEAQYGGRKGCYCGRRGPMGCMQWVGPACYTRAPVQKGGGGPVAYPRYGDPYHRYPRPVEAGPRK